MRGLSVSQLPHRVTLAAQRPRFTCGCANESPAAHSATGAAVRCTSVRPRPSTTPQNDARHLLRRTVATTPCHPALWYHVMIDEANLIGSCCIEFPLHLTGKGIKRISGH